jgi:gamma-glutamyltranspeptidase/glutathione hydrolase
MKNPNLATTFRTLASEGKRGFYQGKIAEEMVKVVQYLGGYLSLEDLKQHAETGSQLVDPISLKFNPGCFRDYNSLNNEVFEIWEHPPNGQGIVALLALGILEELQHTGKIPKFQPWHHNTTDYLHAIIESLRIAFADASWWVTDPDVVQVPVEQLLSRSYLSERAKLFELERASPLYTHGSPAQNHCDTVYFAVTDGDGNGASFIMSNYEDFGSCIIPKGCGFTLQNRGANFRLDDGHPNLLAPGKRPYHTIIPAMTTNRDGSLHSVFGVMGGFMQPQGHVQVLLNMLVCNLNPQAAIDAPRICIGAVSSEEEEDPPIFVEEGISEETIDGLKRLGHRIIVLKDYDRAMFGRGQLILCRHADGRTIFSAGSDPRGDGHAVPL